MAIDVQILMMEIFVKATMRSLNQDDDAANPILVHNIACEVLRRWPEWTAPDSPLREEPADAPCG